MSYSAHVCWSEESNSYVASTIKFGQVIGASGDTPEDAIADLAISLEVVAARIEESRVEARPFSEAPVGGLPADLSDWLEREAERQGVSVTTLIVSALAETRGRALVGQRGRAMGVPVAPRVNEEGEDWDEDVDV